MKRLNLLLLGLIFLGSFAIAQKKQTTTRLCQFTFNYPLGTNGLKSYDFSNNMSLNMLIGLNGGVEGLEFGGLGNINTGIVNGAQFGGLFNITKGDVNGVQFGGHLNITHGNVIGGQFSGLVNVNTGDIKGIQGAGILNANKGNTEHIQISGLINSNYGNMRGLQISGILNANLNKPKKENVELVQLSGLINQNASPMKGAQISSILNVSVDSLKGAQIGLINIGNQIEGTQIGLINISVGDSSDVIPVGLLNFAKNGLFELELSGGDLLYANLNYKMGVEKFYTIFKLGYAVKNKSSIFSYGLGFGSYFKINQKNRISVEISSSNINDEFLLANSFDVLNKFDLNYKYSLNDNFSVFAGPSFNAYVWDNWSVQEDVLLKPHYHISKDSYSYFDLYTWVGVNAGVSFRF